MALFGSSSAFGASSPSPFAGVSSTSNPFGATPPSNPFGGNQNTPPVFGSSTFGSQSGASLFGGTSTGVFGATQASTSTFGASAPAFGSGTSVFGQKPTTPFGGSGSTAGQANPFGSTAFGQSQPALGSTFGSSAPVFGSTAPSFGMTPFGTMATPGFGATSTPAFGATSAPAFGAASTPVFGASTTPAFGAASPAFGASLTPAFGAASMPAFGASTTPAFGAASTPAFGASSAPAYGVSSTPFGATSSSLFGSSTPAFGQSTSAFGNTSSPSFGSTSMFGSGGAATSFGAQTTPAFGSSPTFGSSTFNASFASQQNGTRATSYAPTNDSEAGASGQIGKLMSITAMSTYKTKSFEELRWEDYQAGDKGGPSRGGQQAVAGIFGQSSSPSSLAFSQTQAQSPFGTGASSIFGSKPGLFGSPNTGAGMTPSLSPFGAPASTPSFGQASTPSFGLGTSSPFGTGSSPSFATGFGSSPTFGSPAAPANPFATPLVGSNPFTQGTTSSSFFSTSNQSSNPAVSTPPLGSSLYGSSASPFHNLKPPGLSAPGSSIFGGLPSTPNQTFGSFGFPGLGQSQSGMGFFGAPTTPGISSLSTLAPQPSAPVALSNPFGSLPPMPLISVGGGAAPSPSIQYGISSIPVFEKPAQAQTFSILTPRHIAEKTRIRMQARGYHPKRDGPRVSFFRDVKDTPSTPNGVGLSVSRENPKALFLDQPNYSLNKLRDAALKSREDEEDMVDAFRPSVQDALKSYGHGAFKGPGVVSSPHLFKVEDINPKQDGEVALGRHAFNSGDGREQASNVHEANIEFLMPKLRHLDYYIQPAVQELAAKERAEHGYCSRVKDFVVGREGYGCVKFFGETDIRGLDIEGIIQFNKCEVLVYMDEDVKPPPGLGLNKPAEITLLNVKCLDKKSGEPLSEGLEVVKFEKRLRKKLEDQGAEFISFIATKGEWKFRVKHFSKYSFIG